MSSEKTTAKVVQMEPFQALAATLAKVLPGETRERLTRKIVRLKNGGDQKLDQKLSRIIDRCIEIPGFRHSSRCPEPKLLRAMISASSNPGILFSFLNFWIDQMADLVAFLGTEHGDHLKDLKETLSEYWSPDELNSVLVAGQQRFPDYEQEDILLGAHWVSRFHEHMKAEGNDDTGAESEDSTFDDADFAVWTRKLEHLPAESEQWDQVENFIETVKTLSRKKEAERRKQSRKDRKTIRDFIKKYKREIEYFGTDPESINRVPSEDALNLVHKLGPLFDQHHGLKRKSAVSVEKEAQDIAQRQTLISEIQLLLSQAKKALSSNISAPNQETEQLRQEDQLKEPRILPKKKRRFSDTTSQAGRKTFDSANAKAKAKSVSSSAVNDHTPNIKAISATSRPKVSPKAWSEKRPSPKVREKEKVLRQLLELLIHTDSAKALAATEDASESPLVASGISWRLFLEGYRGLAYQVSRAIEDRWPGFPLVLPSQLLRTVILGSHITSPEREIAQTLTESFTQFTDKWFRGGPAEWNYALSLLGAASSIQPSIIAPQTGASSILRLVHLTELEHLYKLIEQVAKYGDLNLPLNPYSLRHVNNQANWAAEVKSLQNELNVWRNQARSTRLAYRPATQVWKKWLGPKGEIGIVIEPVVRNDQDHFQSVKERINRLQDKKFLNKLVQDTYRKIKKHSGKNQIEATALSQIYDRTDQALEFARRWCKLLECQPGKTSNFPQSQVESLRKRLDHSIPHLVQELDTFSQSHPNLLVAAGVQACHDSIDQLWALFDPESPPLRTEAPARMLVNVDLLRVQTIRLSSDWEPKKPEDSTILEAILESLKEGIPDWGKAFELRFDLRDHIGSGLIISYLELFPPSDLDLEEIKARRHTHIDQCRRELVRDADNTRTEIETGVALGLLLTEKDRDALTARVDKINSVSRRLAEDKDAAEPVNFEELRAELRDVRAKIEKARNDQADQVRGRLNALRLPIDDPNRGRIEACLEQGDCPTANEYIDMLQRGEFLPSQGTKASTFQTFFPTKWRALMEWHEEQKNSRDIISHIQLQRSIGPVQLKDVPGAQIKSAVSLLKHWYEAKDRKTLDSEGARRIFTSLGFTVDKLTIEQDRDRRNLLIQCTTPAIQEREVCPIPTFGSQAKGEYSALCVWDSPTEEELLIAVSRASHHGAKLVFHFGRMTEQRRRDLARLCIERRKSLAVVDDILITYLCGERGLRMPVMFDCSLPFTFAEPYTTTAGLVPPEMFYGRNRDSDTIKDPMGSCFIYGGRQLGKTALLRSVERSFHSLEHNRVAKWMDLKVERIGYDRPLGDIWKLIIREFKKIDVLGPRTPVNLGSRKLLRLIEEWIHKDTSRRILLLLDEADTFLEKDGQEKFVRTAELKGLMDRTDRRFKVVFAGLHNVQRTTRQANNPLAHYGDPICVGPLFNQGEWNEARRLVEKPFTSLGYHFKSTDVVFRILAQTNYYPSLIQIYCKELLRHLTDPHRMIFDSRSSPPYEISLKHVEEVYQSKKLRDGIRRRFNLTLELDSRYQVIAYAIALESLDPDYGGLVEGFPVSQIIKEALCWWPEGFENSSSEEDIRGLLDEMVGLGILRIVSPGKYTLRNPNVLTLLGNREEIETELSKERELPLDFDPASFRAPLNASEPVRRSFLTARQEGEIGAQHNGISFLFGAPAAGIDSIEPSLRNCFQERLVKLDTIYDKSQFEAQLRIVIRRIGKSRRKDTTLVLVPGNCPWGEAWVAAASDALKRSSGKASFLRILFVADPETTWRIVDENTEVPPRVTTFSLRPWDDIALRQWLSDCGFGPQDREGRDQVKQTTGNWPFLLKDFYDRCHYDRKEHWKTALKEMTKELQEDAKRIELLKNLGCSRFEVQRVLSTLASGWNTDEIVELHPNLPEGTVPHVTEWARKLSLLRRGREGREVVEPFTAGLLRNSVGAAR